jgi:hypothetical protein
MYRSLFDRKQAPSIEPAKANGKTTKRARNVFYIVLRYVSLCSVSGSLPKRQILTIRRIF